MLQELQNGGQHAEAGGLGRQQAGADLHQLVLGHHVIDFFLNLTLCQQLIVEENPLGPDHPAVYQVAARMCVCGVLWGGDFVYLAA